MLLVLTVLPSFALSALGAAVQPELLFGPGGQMELENVPDYILAALADYVPEAPSISLVTPTTTIPAPEEPTNGFVFSVADAVDAPAYTIIPSLEQGRLAMADPQPEIITDSNKIATSEIDDVASSTVSDVASASAFPDDSASVQPMTSPTDASSMDAPSSETTSATTVFDTTSDTLLLAPTSPTTVLDVDTGAPTVLDSITESSTTTPIPVATSTHKKHTSIVTSQSIIRPSGPTRIFGPGGTTITLTKTTSSPASSPTVALNAATPQQKATRRTIRAVLIVLAVFFGIFLVVFLLRKRLCRPCCGRDDEEDDIWIAPPHSHAQGASQMGLDAALDKHRSSIHVQQLASCTPQLTSIPRVNYERHGGVGQRVHLPSPQYAPASAPTPQYARPTPPYMGARLTPTEQSPSYVPRFREEQPSPVPVGETAPRQLYGLGFTNIGLGVGEVWQGQYATRNY